MSNKMINACLSEKEEILKFKLSTSDRMKSTLVPQA